MNAFFESAFPFDGEVIVKEWLHCGKALELDLGCHKGAFLVAMAGLFPDRLFFGVERQSERVARARAKIAQQNLGNASVVQADAMDVMERLIPDEAVDVIHVSFPDPWPKRRHWRRRLLGMAFFERAWNVLKENGVLRLRTDDWPYFCAIGAAASSFGRFTQTSWDDGREYPATEFQRKFSKQNLPVYAIALAKRSGTRDLEYGATYGRI